MAGPDFSIQVGADLPVEGVLALYREGGWWSEGEDPAAIPVLLRGSVVVASAWADGRLVGMGRAIGDGASDAYIQDVIVSAGYRHRGIGRALVARLRDECLARGIGWLALVAAPGTSPLYEALGFRVMERYVPMRWQPDPIPGKER